MSHNAIDIMHDIYRRGDEAALGRHGFINGVKPAPQTAGDREVELSQSIGETEALMCQIKNAIRMGLATAGDHERQMALMGTVQTGLQGALDEIRRPRKG